MEGTRDEEGDDVGEGELLIVEEEEGGVGVEERDDRTGVEDREEEVEEVADRD